MKNHNELSSQLRMEYERKQRRAQYLHKQNKAIFYEKYPYLSHIDDSIGDIYLQMMKKAIDGNKSMEDLQREIDLLKAERENYIKINHVDTSLLEMKYDCDICKDTGLVTVDSHIVPCSCYNKRLLFLIYENSNLKDLTSIYSFDNFDLSIFSDKPEKDGISPRCYMSYMKSMGERFSQNLGDKSAKSLLFFGNTGLGKTYLCLSIAERALRLSKSVVYETSVTLFDKLAETVFGKSDEDRDNSFYDMVYDCDLLIIDDLGTEIVNDYINSQFFNIVNTRLLSFKKLIISTNLTMVELKERYERRIISRLFNSDDFKAFKFIGDDLRWKK